LNALDVSTKGLKKVICPSDLNIAPIGTVAILVDVQQHFELINVQYPWRFWNWCLWSTKSRSRWRSHYKQMWLHATSFPGRRNHMQFQSALAAKLSLWIASLQRPFCDCFVIWSEWNKIQAIAQRNRALADQISVFTEFERNYGALLTDWEGFDRFHIVIENKRPHVSFQKDFSADQGNLSESSHRKDHPMVFRLFCNFG
jgi:hypothetical protein